MHSKLIVRKRLSKSYSARASLVEHPMLTYGSIERIDGYLS
jgi:hypothetical protein